MLLFGVISIIERFSGPAPVHFNTFTANCFEMTKITKKRPKMARFKKLRYIETCLVYQPGGKAIIRCPDKISLVRCGYA